MLDTIIYIPTILAYTFISLLVVILAFIVIYVSHKIYISIYDNLPLSQSALASLFLEDSEAKIAMEKSGAVPTAANTILAKHDSCCAYRKSKTVQR